MRTFAASSASWRALDAGEEALQVGLLLGFASDRAGADAVRRHRRSGIEGRRCGWPDPETCRRNHVACLLRIGGAAQGYRLLRDLRDLGVAACEEAGFALMRDCDFGAVLRGLAAFCSDLAAATFYGVFPCPEGRSPRSTFRTSPPDRLASPGSAGKSLAPCGRRRCPLESRLRPRKRPSDSDRRLGRSRERWMWTWLHE